MLKQIYAKRTHVKRELPDVSLRIYTASPVITPQFNACCV